MILHGSYMNIKTKEELFQKESRAKWNECMRKMPYNGCCNGFAYSAVERAQRIEMFLVREI